jgi:hypothetical protein
MVSFVYLSVALPHMVFQLWIKNMMCMFQPILENCLSLETNSCHWSVCACLCVGGGEWRCGLTASLHNLSCCKAALKFEPSALTEQ